MSVISRSRYIFILSLHSVSFKIGGHDKYNRALAMQKLWDLMLANRETLTWLGGGLATLAGGVWAVLKYFFPSDEKTRSPDVALSGTGIASGGDTIISGSVNIGRDDATFEQAMTTAIQPLTDEIRVLREMLTRVTSSASSDEAAPAVQALTALDRGDFVGVSKALAPFDKPLSADQLRGLSQWADQWGAARARQDEARTARILRARGPQPRDLRANLDATRAQWKTIVHMTK